jgi:hypothetical protein
MRGAGGDRPGGPVLPASPAKEKGVQALAILAVGTAAVSFVAGVGTYLYIRFTHHRRKPGGHADRRSP